MKKLLVIMSIIVAAMISHAAVMQWGVSGSLIDPDGPLKDDEPYDGLFYAKPGAQMLLIYNGIDGTFGHGGNVSFAYDFQQGNFVLWNYVSNTPVFTFGTDQLKDNIIASGISTEADYDLGNFLRTIEGVTLDWLGETSADWNVMNDRVFTLISISNISGEIDDGSSYWNFYTGNVKGFSEATGPDGAGGFLTDPDIFDISGGPALPDGWTQAGSGNLMLVPEPATALMLIVGGLGAFIFRRSKVRAQREEA